MTRNIIAILLVLVGVVGIAGGIWGFSLNATSDVPIELLSASRTVLEYADTAVSTADNWLAENLGTKENLTSVLNYFVGDTVDLTSQMSVTLFARQNALTILLCGIIALETGLLLFKRSRR